jgi:hypothetical protein
MARANMSSRQPVAASPLPDENQDLDQIRHLERSPGSPDSPAKIARLPAAVEGIRFQGPLGSAFHAVNMGIETPIASRRGRSSRFAS